LENLDDNVDIESAWESIRESIRLQPKRVVGGYDLKQHKPWFDEECPWLLYQKKAG
jgi:hypothetical protein